MSVSECTQLCDRIFPHGKRESVREQEREGEREEGGGTSYHLTLSRLASPKVIRQRGHRAGAGGAKKKKKKKKKTPWSVPLLLETLALANLTADVIKLWERRTRRERFFFFLLPSDLSLFLSFHLPSPSYSLSLSLTHALIPSYVLPPTLPLILSLSLSLSLFSSIPPSLSHSPFLALPPSCLLWKGSRQVHMRTGSTDSMQSQHFFKG